MPRNNDIQIRVVNADEVRRDLAKADAATTKAINDKVKEFTKDLFMELVRTSPVKSGYYQSQWDYEEAKKDDGYIITNDDDKAKFLVFPNSRMVGSSKADEPSEGILHNVRGIVFNKRTEFNKEIAKTLKRMLD